MYQKFQVKLVDPSIQVYSQPFSNMLNISLLFLLEIDQVNIENKGILVLKICSTEVTFLIIFGRSEQDNMMYDRLDSFVMEVAGLKQVQLNAS